MALVSPSYGFYATPPADSRFTTSATFNADDAGYIASYKRAETNGADHAYYIKHPDDATFSHDVQRFVQNTKRPIIFQTPAADGPTLHYPGGVSTALAPNHATVISAFTAHLTNTVAPLLGTTRPVAIGFGNEIDDWLKADAATRVPQYTSFVAAMKTQAELIWPGVHTFVSFKYFSVKDNSFASNSYATVSAAGSYPVFTYYPVDAVTFAVEPFNTAPTDVATAFSNMLNATGAPLAFGLQEAGCPTNASLTSGAPGGGGQATQLAFFLTLIAVFNAYRDAGLAVKFGNVLWEQDVLDAVWQDAIPGIGPSLLGYLDSMGLRTTFNVPKSAYAPVVQFLGGSLDPAKGAMARGRARCRGRF